MVGLLRLSKILGIMRYVLSCQQETAQSEKQDAINVREASIARRMDAAFE